MAPRPLDLESHREWIISRLNSGCTLHNICCHLPVEGPTISERTLRRRLNAWGIANPELGARGTQHRKRHGRELQGAKEFIIGAYRRGDSGDKIRADVETRFGTALSRRTLYSRLEEWGVSTREDECAAAELRDLVTAQVQDGLSVADVMQSIEVNFGVRKKAAWVYAKLKEWDVPPPQRAGLRDPAGDDMEAIQEFIRLTFFEARQKDEDLHVHLRAMGYIVTLAKVKAIRKGMGLVRRHTQQQADRDLERLREAMGSSPRCDILVPRLTKKMLPVFFKQEFNISISRAMAWRFLKERYPEEMLNRVREAARRRAGFLCPGPNYIWSIDAYCKLAPWGIEVYACIDAYSRYIIWAHVGHTAQTQRSVCLQYLDTVRALGYLPMVVRSDHGVETGMIAGAHYWLSAPSTEGRLLKPTRDDDGNVVWIYREAVNGMEVRNVVYPDQNGNTPPPTFGPLRQLDFSDCYSYGLSTKNQRIESWWQELNFHITMYWRNVFTGMQNEQDWSEHRIADRIALLYTFLPQVHWEIGKFIRMWNGHTIRKQRNRPHVVSGIPRHNYFGRDTAARINCAVAVDDDHLGRMEEALEHDRENVSAYLTGDMMGLCEAMMATLDIDATPPRDPIRPLIHEYRHLRCCLQRHEEEQVAPLLRLADKPTGGWHALEQLVQETGRSLADILGEDIEDGFDPALDI